MLVKGAKLRRSGDDGRRLARDVQPGLFKIEIVKLVMGRYPGRIPAQRAMLGKDQST